MSLCNSEDAVTVDFDIDNMDARKLKEGEILKYKSGFLGGKWKKHYAVLFSDSRFCWFEDKGDRKPKGSVLLKDVVPYICVGLMTDRMPTKRPSVPDGHSVHHLVGIGMDPRAETVHWILFSSDSDIESWFNEIVKTLPKLMTPPPQQNSGAPPPTYPQGQNTSGGYVPPQKYPDGPPPVQPMQSGGYSSGGPPPSYNQGYLQQSYPQGGGGYSGGYAQPTPTSHTTVIVRDGGGGYGGGYSSGLGSGLMGFGGGMLAGSLLGYGLGHHYGSGFGFGPSYGYGMGGMGGGFYSDNDTTTNNVTNNYYNSSVDHNAGAIDSGGHPGDANEMGASDFGGASYDFGGNDGPSYDMGGGNFEASDFGGNDFGTSDFSGGGDFGGGDFGGGDF